MSEQASKSQVSNEEALLKHLFCSTPDHVYFKDLDGRFLMINQAHATSLGLNSPEEAVGKTDFDFFSREHAEKALRDERQIIKTGESMTDVEEKLTRPDGRFSWVSATKEALRDNDGNILGTFGISRNITIRHEAQERAALYAEELKELHKLTQDDLALAAEMQAAMLTVDYPAFTPNGRHNESAIRFAHVYQPAGAVGGDLLCIEKVSDSTAGIFICDAIGHGVRSALLSSMVLSLFHELHVLHAKPGLFLSKLNERVSSLMSRCPDVVFATACYLTINSTTQKIVCANAGHPSPVLMDGTSGKCRNVIPDQEFGPALALNKEAAYTECTCDINPGSRVVMVTDGIIEAGINNAGDEYGEDRLWACIEQHVADAPDELLAAILSDLNTFSKGSELEDDLCAVCIELTKAESEHQ